MKVTVSISNDNLLKLIYAESAFDDIRRAMEGDDVICSEHRNLLLLMCRNALAGLLFHFQNCIGENNISEEPIPDIYFVEFEVADTCVPSLLVTVLQSAIASQVLAAHVGRTDSRLADSYRACTEYFVDTMKMFMSTMPGERRSYA